MELHNKRRKRTVISLIAAIAFLLAFLSSISVVVVMYTYGVKVSSGEIDYRMYFEETFQESGSGCYVIEITIIDSDYFSGEIIPYQGTLATDSIKIIKMSKNGKILSAGCTPREIKRSILPRVIPNGFDKADRNGTAETVVPGYGVRYFDSANKVYVVYMSMEEMALAADDFIFTIHCTDKDIVLIRENFELCGSFDKLR
jgi:intracellular sulfur oxidation DsrE/DsrF family protein